MNINDLPDEGSGKLIELTIRYKNLEWSISCTKNDFEGHGSGAHRIPHYHFSFRDGNRTIIRFNDFHVPFHEYDVVSLAAKFANPEFIKHHVPGGEGMDDIMTEAMLEKIIDTASTNGDGFNAPFKFEHLIMADEGTTMRGEDIQALFQEAKEKNVTVGSLLRQGRIPNAKVTTVVTPGPGVVEQYIRGGRGKNKQNNE